MGTQPVLSPAARVHEPARDRHAGLLRGSGGAARASPGALRDRGARLRGRSVVPAHRAAARAHRAQPPRSLAAERRGSARARRAAPPELPRGAVRPDADSAGGLRVFAQYDRDLRAEADVVVVGSGPGGAVVARELACAGARVILIEEGPPFPPAEFR
ncbi:MAG: FAD-dependent monooxygenase, partial [Deltaproteobacteria bacterium]